MLQLEGRWKIYHEFIQFYEYLSKHINCHLGRTIVLTALCEGYFSLVCLAVRRNFMAQTKPKVVPLLGYRKARTDSAYAHLFLFRVTRSAGGPTTNPLDPSIRRASSLRIKWPGREAVHSLPYLAEVNARAVLPLFHMSR